MWGGIEGGRGGGEGRWAWGGWKQDWHGGGGGRKCGLGGGGGSEMGGVGVEGGGGSEIVEYPEYSETSGQLRIGAMMSARVCGSAVKLPTSQFSLKKILKPPGQM